MGNGTMSFARGKQDSCKCYLLTDTYLLNLADCPRFHLHPNRPSTRTVNARIKISYFVLNGSIRLLPLVTFNNKESQ